MVDLDLQVEREQLIIKVGSDLVRGRLNFPL